MAGVVAANLPDADLIYVRITPPPLGYLLHHRGHTHTVAGLVPLALLIGAVCLLPRIRRHVEPLRARFWGLIVVSLLGHLVLDSWNSYGVHPFWPIDVRWYYGDAISIFEPWLWLLLGVAATLNTRNRGARVVLGAGLAALAGALAVFGMIPVGALLALAVGAAALAVVARAWPARTRAGVALALTALFVVAMFALRLTVNDRALASLAPASRGTVIDVVLGPKPANPLCWSALAITRDDAAGEYVMTRGTVAVLAPSGCGPGNHTGVRWDNPQRQSLAQLRELNAQDCSVRAWMQFGRAPDVSDTMISDLRFGGAARGNFSAMRLTPADHALACPPNMTHWGIPRADLLGTAMR